jgi:hypothetical protein
MPKVFGALPDDQAWKLIAYIRSIYQGDPSRIDWYVVARDGRR